MLCAVASEVEDELDRALKDQDRLQDELEFTCEGVWSPPPGSLQTAGPCTMQRALMLNNTSATVVRLMKQLVLK